MQEDCHGTLIRLCLRISGVAKISNDHSYHIAPFLGFVNDTLKQTPLMADEECRQALEKLVLLVLNEAAGRMAAAPAYFEDILECCQRYVLPKTYNWFKAQREAIATASPGHRWNQLLEIQIMTAALLQTSIPPP